MKNILLLEDNQDMIDLILQRFDSSYNFYVYKKHSDICLDLKNISLIILDMNLAGNECGLDFARDVRANRFVQHIPIIMISSNYKEMDIIQALKIGVNDYISKPFNFECLGYKIANFLILNENSVALDDSLLIKDEIELVIPDKMVTINKCIIKLTKKEFDIFHILVQNYNKSVDRHTILSRINKGSKTTQRIVDTHILNIRKKLPPEYSIRYLNVGYCLSKQ